MNLKNLFTKIYTVQIILLIALVIMAMLMFQEQKKLKSSYEIRVKSLAIAQDLRQSSDDLTRYCRTYVLTGDSSWENKYWEVLDIRNGKKPRLDGTTIALLDSMRKLGFTKTEFEKLKESEQNSNDLVWTETVAFHAMKGLFDDGTGNFSIKNEPNPTLAHTIMFDKKYHTDKFKIMTPIDEFIDLLYQRTNNTIEKHIIKNNWLFGIIIGLIIFIGSISIISYFIIKNKIIIQLNELKTAKEKIEESETKLKQINKELDEKVDKRTKQLDESEEQLKLISNNFVNGMLYQMVMIDENTRQFTYVSDAVFKLYGCTAEQAKKDPDLIYSKIHPDDIEGILQKEKEAFKKMSIFKAESRVINPDGSFRWSYYVSRPRLKEGLVCWDGVEIDITEQKKMELELLEAKDKAEESDRLKSAFLANMSHEIRTPMNGILGFANLLKEPDLTGKEQQNYISIIEKSGARMLNIINDIVDISKIESGLLEVNLIDLSINELNQEVYAFLLPEVEDKGLNFSFKNSLPEAKSVISTDREKVYAILSNLIKNAIKFTKFGAIEFGYLLEENMLKFYVRDSGLGIPKSELQSIFKRFTQATNEDKQVYEGAGLGLSIAKAYIEILGGEIWVESELGKGSTFYFTIPYRTKNQTKKVIEDIIPKTDNEVQMNKLKILIVEDDDASQELLSTILKKFSKEILFAKNGVVAVEICRNNPDLDLILMDIKMPQMNGYKATKEIRKFNNDVIIIAQTAFAFAIDKDKAIKAGCNDYLSKPISSKKLAKLISNYKNTKLIQSLPLK